VNLNSKKTRTVSVALVAALTIATLAPAAQAERLHHRDRHGRRIVVIERHGDSFGPTLLGFLGGFVLGTVVSQSSREYDRPVPDECAYYDPYCDREFDSFRDYDRHLRCFDHSARLMVLDRRDRPVARYERVDGRWERVTRFGPESAWEDRGDSYRDDAEREDTERGDVERGDSYRDDEERGDAGGDDER
jgi:hypothetical protein